MGARDRWTYDVTCPDCGATGTVQVSENDYPFMRDLDHQIEKVPEGFEVLRAGTTAMHTEIGCIGCKVRVK
jgi:hypothetical protein